MYGTQLRDCWTANFPRCGAFREFSERRKECFHYIVEEKKKMSFFYRIGQSFKNERLIDSFRQCSMELLLHLHSVIVLIVETVVKKGSMFLFSMPLISKYFQNSDHLYRQTFCLIAVCSVWKLKFQNTFNSADIFLNIR